jgi:peptidoglycan/xylan/chitin deacetylase (PgdA/CDA1 family)
MSHLHWKRRLGRLAALGPAKHSRRVILLYHSLGSLPPAVTIERFTEQMAWLKANAVVLPLDRLLDSATDQVTDDRLQVALTFDDGYASLHAHVAPLLPPAAATVFLNTGRIHDSQRQSSDPRQGHYPREHFLLWQEVQDLVRAGWLIGSHGVEHTDLTAVDAQRCDEELCRSKAAIETALSKPCRYFAYTWGRYHAALQQRVKAAGYQAAASGLHGPLTAASDRFALPRIDVRADYELEDFIAAVRGDWDFLGYKQRAWRLLA